MKILPFPGTMLDQPYFVMETIRLCEDVFARARGESGQRAHAEMIRQQEFRSQHDR